MKNPDEFPTARKQMSFVTETDEPDVNEKMTFILEKYEVFTPAVNAPVQ